MEGFGMIIPTMGRSHIAKPKGIFLCRSTSYNVEIVKIGPPVLLHSSPFYPIDQN